MNNKKTVFLALLATQAIILSFIERLIPLDLGVPGIKLGLANIITIIALYLFSVKDAFIVLTIRILLSALLFGTLSSVLYSLAGGILSLLFMSLLYRYAGKHLSIIGISVVGGLSHNFGQLMMASLLVQNLKLMFYLPVLSISGIITGIFIGMTCKYLVGYLEQTRIFGGTNGNRKTKK